MIVCLCRGISDRQVAEAVRGGARTAEEIGRRCGGAGEDCGTCRPLLEEYGRGGPVERAA